MMRAVGDAPGSSPRGFEFHAPICDGGWYAGVVWSERVTRPSRGAITEISSENESAGGAGDAPCWVGEKRVLV
jgi:hypothetical protein